MKYSDQTAIQLATQLLKGMTKEHSIAVVSAPSVFVQIQNMLRGCEHSPGVCLLEYDERFGILEDVVRYDFHKPCQLPGQEHAWCQCVEADVFCSGNDGRF